MASDLTSDPWLAGFADGEATFVITASGGRLDGRRRAWTPRFALSLRVDDIAILRELHAALGGSIQVCRKRPTAHPTATWTVTAKRDLSRLLDYFDRFPLRSKKARDYAVWREAAVLYIECDNAADIVEEMDVLRETLRGGRLFVAGADDPVVAAEAEVG